MKVYIVAESDYDMYEIMGVFSNEEEAKRFQDSHHSYTTIDEHIIDDVVPDLYKHYASINTNTGEIVDSGKVTNTDIPPNSLCKVSGKNLFGYGATLKQAKKEAIKARIKFLESK